jgi:crotonobetainyl-CoA:carnitine CoA-transferase CaiB-like acyl-CoA transferase
VRHRDFVVPLIAELMRTRAQRDWLTPLDAAGVPCGPINRLDQVFADPQVIARGMRIDMPHPLAGSVPQVGNPLKFSATPVAYTRAPPLLGEHTREVLSARLGLADAALEELAGRGVIQLSELRT